MFSLRWFIKTSLFYFFLMAAGLFAYGFLSELYFSLFPLSLIASQ